MSLYIDVVNDTQKLHFDHSRGPLEFGRGPQRDVKRCLIDGDPMVSRDQLRIEERSPGRLHLENLSRRTPALLPGRGQIDEQQSAELELPVTLIIGNTRLSIKNTIPEHSGGETEHRREQIDSLSSSELVPIPPADQVRFDKSSLLESGVPVTAGAAEQIHEWLQRIIELQQAGAGSPEFYGKAAQVLIDLVGMDLGLVLLQRDGTWSIAGSAVASDRVSIQYSKTLLNHVVENRQTFYEDLGKLGSATESLVELKAGVASPIFGLEEDVLGVLYGVRAQRGLIARGTIDPLEAQLVQLLAGAVGTNLARSMAQRTRVQFEQFFSHDLVRELERDPNLLEGRTDEVTILFSDLRGFTPLSERLGAQKTCLMLNDMMERLSERIVEQGGVIVDFAGDGILAMWNAPAKQPDHPARACRAALAMLGELSALNARWSKEAAGSLSLGIGINTGEVLVGNTGCGRKFKYGPHGHAVNLAARVQDVTKKLGLPLLITASTSERLPSGFPLRRIGRIALQGVRAPVLVYELFGGDQSPKWLRLREAYELALALYEAGQWSRACQILMPLLGSEQEAAAQDVPTLKLIRRALECLEMRPDPFDPLLEVAVK